MWLFQLFGLSVVAGVIVGVTWRMVEGFVEHRAFQKSKATVKIDQ